MSTRVFFVALVSSALLRPALSAAGEEERTGSEEGSDSEAVPSGGEVSVAIEHGAVLLSTGERRVPIELPAPALEARLVGDLLYVAAGPHGAFVFDVSDPKDPALVGRSSTATGEVVGFIEADGRIWMKLASTTAVPLGPGGASDDRAAPVLPAASTLPAARPAPSKGEKREAPVATADGEPIAIESIRLGRIELGIGADDGVEVGDRYAVLREPAAEEDEEEYAGRELAAVVTVVAVREDSCLAELGRGARVSANDTIEPAGAERGASVVYPERLTGIYELAYTVRPLIKVGKPLGGGLLADLRGAYWGDFWFADVRVQPLGLGWTKKGNVVSTSALLEGGYDGQAFGVGVGVGVSAVNGDMDHMLDHGLGSSEKLSAAPDEEPERSWDQRTRAALAISQQVRLGARDGLHATLYNLMIRHEDKDDKVGFIYGGSAGKFSIPLGSRTDLYLEGGGGVMGYGFGAIGVSSWLIGNGDAGSLALSVSAGGAAVWGAIEVTEKDSAGTVTDRHTDTVLIAGPIVSLGLTHRFGDP
ncbi:MAG: hypothetical protein R6V85_11735 [Polyangia bacterium]